MEKRRNRKTILASIIVLFLIGVIVPIQVFGKVQPITEVEDKLDGITEEEKAVLQELFTINQKIEELEKEKEKINNEIISLQKQISTLEEKIAEIKAEYDRLLSILKEVLKDYQRGGASTYLEVLLGAKNLSGFLKSLNVMKDISHNVNELLASLEKGKKRMQEEKKKLAEKSAVLEDKERELSENIAKNQVLQKDKEAYLSSLQEDKALYTERLLKLQSMWEACKTIFPKLAKEITDTINEGYFTYEDLNLETGFMDLDGYIEEDIFNGIVAEKTSLSQTEFRFEDDKVVLVVPSEHLVLKGNFILEGESAIRFEVLEGTFYNLPLESASIEELFTNGPMRIDFNSVSQGIITIEFVVNKVKSEEGRLTFQVNPKW